MPCSMRSTMRRCHIRAAIVPVTNIGSRLSMPLIVLGLALSGLGQVFYYVALAGVACYGLCVVFQLVTLPTEFNASHRALRAIEESALLLLPEEQTAAKRVLTAAALTYVAALERDRPAVPAPAAHRGGREPEERLTMDERTEQGRRFLMGYRDDDTTEFVSDQEKKLPQPPLCKAPMGGERTVLPRDFSALPEGGGLYGLLTTAAQRQNLYGGGAQPAAAFVPALGHAGRARHARPGLCHAAHCSERRCAPCL